MFGFKFERQDGWPPLAWCAECERGAPVVRVIHGPQVETREFWFCEAVWDGEFALGGFDRTDLVFGSGGRSRNGRVIFVSSGSTVDRLQYAERDGRVWVSNSLACLLAMSGIGVDATYGDFPEFFRSIVRGINCYERRLPTLEGRLELTYFRNLVWDGECLVEQDKPELKRDFGTFERYHDFMQTSIGRLADNMRAAARGHSYEMVAGLSSGYDSTTTAVLGRQAGMSRGFSFRTARGGQMDHGEQISPVLGLELTTVRRRAWRRQEYAEVPYLAATGLGADVVFSSAKEELRGRVLMTGFHGDKVWAKETKSLGPDIVRGDASGLAFTEQRLILGCIHLPLPFLGVRQIQDIHALSNSAELAPWDVPGNYSRPICRRIAEEAGVPRQTFGVSKKAATNLFRQGEAALTESSRVAYHAWLRENTQRWRDNGLEAPNVPGRMLLAFRSNFHLVTRLVASLKPLLPTSIASWLGHTETKIERRLTRRINLAPYLFPWAVERLANMYRQGYRPREEKLIPSLRQGEIDNNLGGSAGTGRGDAS